MQQPMQLVWKILESIREKKNTYNMQDPNKLEKLFSHSQVCQMLKVLRVIAYEFMVPDSCGSPSTYDSENTARDAIAKLVLRFEKEQVHERYVLILLFSYYIMENLEKKHFYPDLELKRLVGDKSI